MKARKAHPSVTYFVGRKYQQEPEVWKNIVSQLGAFKEVSVVAAGRRVVEVEVSPDGEPEFIRMFSAICHIERPVDFEVA